jgi:hypothetical protein
MIELAATRTGTAEHAPSLAGPGLALRRVTHHLTAGSPASAAVPLPTDKGSVPPYHAAERCGVPAPLIAARPLQLWRC